MSYLNVQMRTRCSFLPHLEAADSFLPGSNSREVDLVQGLIGQLQVNTLWCYGELERHSLVSLRHFYENTS